jgi:hypothetical protein
MLEYMDKYRDVPRTTTCTTIDKPILIFLGLAIADFISGVCTFLAIVLLWDSGWAVFAAMAASTAAAWGAREYRRRYPERFLQQWSWSMGLQKVTGVPDLFLKRRIQILGP